MVHSICLISGGWYEFGNVDGKMLTAILASLGIVVILYLFFTPRKVNKPNTIWFIACINLIRYVILTIEAKRFLLALLIGGKGTKNTCQPHMGYF